MQALSAQWIHWRLHACQGLQGIETFCCTDKAPCLMLWDLDGLCLILNRPLPEA